MLKEIIDKNQSKIKGLFDSEKGYLEYITSLGYIITGTNPSKVIYNYISFLYEEKLNKPKDKRINF